MRVLAILIAVASFFSAPSFAVGAELAKGETETNVYMEFSYFNDRGIAWTGSEIAFQTRFKLDMSYAIYDDILVRTKMEWVPTVSKNTIGYSGLVKKEFYPEDIYLLFKDLFGYQAALRVGVVKTPFGHFDTFAYDDKSRPISFMRTRGWDFGLRLDTKTDITDISLAIINGDGREGTDANSAKSVVLRFVFPGSEGDVYPVTLESTKYPNPVMSNPDGDFSFELGLSAYVGNLYSTPIKERNSHYGVDVKIDYSVFSFKAQYTYLEGGYTNQTVRNNDDVDLSNHDPSVTTDTDTFPKGYAVFAELAVGITSKTLLTIMVETYEPDTESDETSRQEEKQRTVLALKYDFRPGITFAFLYTYNDNPYYDKDYRPSDDRGDDVYQAGVSASF